MRKPMLAVALAALLSPASVPAETRELPDRISWTIEENDSRDRADNVQFSLSYRIDRPGHRSNWMHSNSMPLSELQGLTPAQYSSAGGAPVHFRMVREAGSFDCEGIVRRRRGAGDCRFIADPAFSAALTSRGFGTPSTPQLFSLATSNIGHRYVDELQRQGYARTSVDDLVRAGDHGVGYDYLREMGALGYRVRTLAALIEMRDHGVSADYVRQLVASGLKDIPAETLVSMRDHGVSPAYIAELRRAGYSNLPVSELIRLRDHGVSADYAKSLAAHGIRLRPDELIRLRDHGVSADYVAELRAAGYRDFGPDEIVRLRDNGVSADFVRRASAGGRLSVDELVRRRNGG